MPDYAYLTRAWAPYLRRDGQEKKLTSPRFSPVDKSSDIPLQPKTHDITEDQLINEVRAIYAGLAMVEKKCIEIVKPQKEKTEELIAGLQWPALTSLYRTILHEHHDFFLASNSHSHGLGSFLRHVHATHKHQKQLLSSALADVRQLQDVEENKVRIFEIPGLLANHSTKALGDYCAKKNFIKEEYAIRLGLAIDRNAVSTVTVGSGNTVMTTGTTTASFGFEGEQDVYNIKFHLLPNCIQNVILGKTFLKFTETLSNLSNFVRRVKERVVQGISQFHLLYLGCSSPTIQGSINGQSQTALADSGAKALVMNEAYALSNNISCQSGQEHQNTLTFADGSTADTSGMAYDVEWRFGYENEFTSPYRLNFHILKNAPANVILCDTFLYDTGAFSQYNHYLVDNDDDFEDGDDYCFAIDVDRRKKRLQTPKLASSVADLQYMEIIRRGDEEDRISALPENEQTAAHNIENERCAQWDRTFATLQNNSQTNSLQQLSATIPQLQSTHPGITNPPRSNLSRKRKWRLWTRSTWLTG